MPRFNPVHPSSVAFLPLAPLRGAHPPQRMAAEPPPPRDAVVTRLVPAAAPTAAPATASIAPNSRTATSTSSRATFTRAAAEGSPSAFPRGTRSLSSSATVPACVPSAAGTPAADKKLPASGSDRRPPLGVRGHGPWPRRRGGGGSSGGGGSGGVDDGGDDNRGHRGGWGTWQSTASSVAPSGAGGGRTSDIAPRVLSKRGGDRRADDRRYRPSGGRPDYGREAGSGAAAPASAAPWRSSGGGRAGGGGGRGGGGGGGALGGGVRYPPRRRPLAAAPSVGGEAPLPAGGITPWAVGDDVAGTVTRVLSYGAFVSLPDGSTGLVHISEVAHRFVSDLTAEVSVGDAVTVRVMSVSGSGPDRKVALSMKRVGGPSGAYERLLVLGGEFGDPWPEAEGGRGRARVDSMLADPPDSMARGIE